MGRSPWWLPWVIYCPLALLGGGLSWVQRGAVFTAPSAPAFASDPRAALGLGFVLALALVGLTLFATRVLVARTRWARTLHLDLRAALFGASKRRLLALALASAVGEELFFRGALVPLCGVAVSAVLFGALHYSSRANYAGFMAWATLMGLAFGALFLGSGSLWPAIFAHAAINFENMKYICRHAPTPLDSAPRAPQRAWLRRL